MVSTASVYGPSRGLMERDFSRFGVQSSYVDTSDLTQVEKALRPNTKVVYVETPSNPTMQVTDIAQSRRLPTRMAAWWWWTTPSPARISSGHWS